VHAWAKLEAKFPNWRLKIVGPDEVGHRAELERLALNWQLSRISFEPPLYGEAKVTALQSADLFVFPTLNDNFGLVVAEALAAGTPVISTNGAPWGELPTRGCGWWIDAGVEPLSTALANAMDMPSATLKSMGSRGRVWNEQCVLWSAIADEMIQVYRWLATKGERPATVQLH